MRDIWQSAQVEAVTWHSPTDESKTPHHHIDMRAAYLACDRRDFRADSDAASEIERYGFPTHVQRLAVIDSAPLTVDSPALALTGAVQLTEWTFSAKCHPFTPGVWATTCVNTRAGLPRQSFATCSRAVT